MRGRITSWPAERRLLKPIMLRPSGSSTLLAPPEALLLLNRGTQWTSERRPVSRTPLTSTLRLRAPR